MRSLRSLRARRQGAATTPMPAGSRRPRQTKSRSACALLVCLALAGLAHPSAAAGGAAAMFDLGVSTRLLGMGGASAAVFGEASAGLNPALLGWADQVRLESLYADQFGAASTTAFALSAPHVAIAAAVLDSGWIVSGEDPLRFASQGLSCAAGTAFGALGVGAQWRYLHVGAPFTGNGWAADVGVAAELGAVRFGLTVDALASSGMLFDRDRREDWARSLSLGVGARVAVSSHVRLQGALDWVEALSGTGRLVGGMEISLGRLAARWGWDGEGWTLGASVVAHRVEVDWCSVVRSDLGVSHRVSLQWVLSGGGEGSR